MFSAVSPLAENSYSQRNLKKTGFAFSPQRLCHRRFRWLLLVALAPPHRAAPSAPAHPAAQRDASPQDGDHWKWGRWGYWGDWGDWGYWGYWGDWGDWGYWGYWGDWGDWGDWGLWGLWGHWGY